MDNTYNNVFKMEKGIYKTMIVKIFKVSTAEMWTLKNKERLLYFIEKETGVVAPDKLTIERLVKYLPVEDYCRVK